MQKKIRIFIADDNPLIRTTVKDILEQKGYIVETIKDGYELLATLKNKVPDVIILDLIMPEKNGLEILSTIKTVSPNIKVIIYTGFKKYSNSIYARSADKFLLKGDSPQKLLNAIKDLTEDK